MNISDKEHLYRFLLESIKLFSARIIQSRLHNTVEVLHNSLKKVFRAHFFIESHRKKMQIPILQNISRLLVKRSTLLLPRQTNIPLPMLPVTKNIDIPTDNFWRQHVY